MARHRFGTFGGAFFLSIDLKKVTPRRFQSSVKPEHSQRELSSFNLKPAAPADRRSADLFEQVNTTFITR